MKQIDKEKIIQRDRDRQTESELVREWPRLRERQKHRQRKESEFVCVCVREREREREEKMQRHLEIKKERGIECERKRKWDRCWIFFDQHLGAVHSKCGSKYDFAIFLRQKAEKDRQLGILKYMWNGA